MAIGEKVHKLWRYPYKDISDYSSREATLYEHRTEIRKYFGFEFLDKKHNSQLQAFITPFIEKGLQTIESLDKLLKYCCKEKIVILTGLSHLEQIIWQTRQDIELNIQEILVKDLTSEQKKLLNKSLDRIENSHLSDFGWLKNNIGTASISSFHEVLKKLDYMGHFDFIPEELSIPAVKIKELINLGATYEASSLRKFNEAKRFSILIVFFYKLRKTLIDIGIQIHDRQMRQLKKKSQQKLEKQQKDEGKVVNQKVLRFVEIGEILIEARERKLNPITILEQKIGWDKIISDVEEAKLLAKPKNFSYLDFIDSRYSHLRGYSPEFLKYFTFIPIQSSSELMKSIDVLQKMNHTHTRKVPEDAPTAFLPEKWKRHIFKKDGKIEKRYYEIAILDEINNEIKAGNLAVKGSGQYQNFENYLVKKKEWETTGLLTHQLNVSTNFDEFIGERISKLQGQITRLKEELPNSTTSYDLNGKIHLRKLPSLVPEEAPEFVSMVFSKIPHVKLTNMLMEVAKWTGFSDELTHLSTGKTISDSELPVLFSSLMALGTNIGLSKMADHTFDASYHQLAYVSQWYLNEDGLRKAIAQLVNFQRRRPLAVYWGDGTKSSSDGLRMKVPVSSFHAGYNGHFGFDKGITLYRSVADQYQSYHTKIINMDSREALHILDGLLAHHTELDIQEHYTDTHGYTDQIFALCHLFGIKFAPRIKGISDLRLFYVDEVKPDIKKYFYRKINFDLIKRNFDDILRLAHSIHEGTVSSSLILSKLGSYARKNSLAQALKELGRIEKTIYLIEYFLNEELQRRVQKGLNKGESINALSRKLNFGQQNEYYDPTYVGQTQKALSSDLLLNVITVWNTVYMEAAIEELEKTGENCPNLIPFISPIHWEHINFFGDYLFDLEEEYSLEKLRIIKG